jgi:hypothetical protein
VLTTPSGILETAAGFYQELYARKPSHKQAYQRILRRVQKIITPAQAQSLTRMIAAREVQKSIKRATLGRSPGIDGLQSEFCKTLLRHKCEDKPPLIVERLTSLYNDILRRKELPKDWTRGVLTILYNNKGDKQHLKNYRPLSLINVDYKVSTEILMERLLD